MVKKITVISIICCVNLLIFFSCTEDATYTLPGNEQTDDNTDNTTINSVDFKATIADALNANSKIHGKSTDYTWDTSSIVYITLKNTSADIDGSGATSNGSTVSITSAGTYSISGSLYDGKIIINSSDDDPVKLILAGINITCSSGAPLYIEKADKVIIALSDNSDNYLTDGSTYVYDSVGQDEPNAVLFSKSDLTLSGSGKLTVNGNYADGIASKDGLVISSGNIVVNSADDGIRGKDYLAIYAGNITVTSKGDGLKSDNDSDSTKGFIYINSGIINITSTGGDAISAQTDVLISDGVVTVLAGGGSSKNKNESVSTKGIKGLVNTIIEGGTIDINSTDDAIHSNGNIAINGGYIGLSSADDGIHAGSIVSIGANELNITKAYEGIESPYITINSGNVNIVASDDAFNATQGSAVENDDGSCLTINGGTISVNSSGGDGLDSNGSISISGGTIVVHGPQSQPEVGMDYNGTCKITGGLLVISAPGSNMTQGPSTSSTQYSLKLITASSLSAGTLFHIQDESGNDIVTFKPIRSYSSIVFSSPAIKNGSKYTIYTGGSSSGTESNGLYTGGTYTPGTQYSSFTISSIVTAIGSSSQGPPSR